MTLPFLIGGWDLETTGLFNTKTDNQDGQRIIEFAMHLYKEDGTVVKKYNKRIYPKRSISPKAQAVHGISLKDLVDCEEFADLASDIRRLFEFCKYTVAHNGKGFDEPFLDWEFRNAKLKMPRVPLLDTMLEGRWSTTFGKLPKLSELAFACDVEYDLNAAHAASYDIDVMMSCFFKGREWGRFAPPVSR